MDTKLLSDFRHAGNFFQRVRMDGGIELHNLPLLEKNNKPTGIVPR
jgi:hypothetical protein